jgi:hypothetical protein
VLISSQSGKAVQNQKDQNDPQSRSHFIAVARLIFLGRRKTYELLQHESGCVSLRYYRIGARCVHFVQTATATEACSQRSRGGHDITVQGDRSIASQRSAQERSTGIECDGLQGQDGSLESRVRTQGG